MKVSALIGELLKHESMLPPELFARLDTHKADIAAAIEDICPKPLELFTEKELRLELDIIQDQATIRYILRALGLRPGRHFAGSEELFKDQQGRAKPGYMTTKELITELDAEPEGTARKLCLVVEAVGRSERGAFPLHRVPALMSIPGIGALTNKEETPTVKEKS
jgi:hypothetical protein